MYKPLLLLISLFVFACSSSKKQTQKDPVAESQPASQEEGSVTIRNISRFPDIQNQNDLSKIMKELEKADCVNEDGVGFAGEYTRTYALFERMKQLATEIQLSSFLTNKNPVVRVYAFRALKDLKYPSAGRAKEALDRDTAQVCWFTGCNKITTAVSSFSKSEE